jgi:Flp pilus assembly protein TadD
MASSQVLRVVFFFLMVAGFVAATGCRTVVNQKRIDRSYTLYCQARIEVEKEKYVEAERLLRNAVSENPYNAKAYQLLGQVYDSFNQAEKARACIERALELDPSLSKYHTYNKEQF